MNQLAVPYSNLSQLVPMTFEVFFRWVAWLLTLAILAFTLSPIEHRPVTSAPADLERFAAFVVTGAAFWLAYPKQRFGIMLLVTGGGALLETAQALVPGRHGRLEDGLIKALGTLLGAAIALLIEREIKRRRKIR
ncbi:VanZ family protein [Microvirga brassicacearum]